MDFLRVNGGSTGSNGGQAPTAKHVGANPNAKTKSALVQPFQQAYQDYGPYQGSGQYGQYSQTYSYNNNDAPWSERTLGI